MARPLLAMLRAWCAPQARRFRDALADPEKAQRQLLADIASGVGRTAYGASHDFSGDAANFRKLPVVTWDDIAPWADRQRREGGRVLCPDPVAFWEPTSGSSEQPKLIPYTRALRRSYGRMFAVWCHDVLRNGPGLRTGRIYISISPRLGRDDDEGLADDADYLSSLLRPFFRRYMVRPDGIEQERDGERFRRRTALALLAADDLEVISVWSPTFLTVLLDLIVADAEGLLEELAVQHPARARALARTLTSSGGLREVWPALKLVSCWADGHAAAPAEALREALGVWVQPKGLLATEAPVTLPLMEAGDDAGQVPLLTEVVIELEDDGGEVRWLHEAETGGRYRVVLSQRGGLARYRLGDWVEVSGRLGDVPLLRFAGRGDGVSDLVGEKLDENVVEDVLARLAPDAGFRALWPSPGAPRRYVLLVDRGDGPALAAQLDDALRSHHHYRLARELGQLAAPEVVVDDNVAQRVSDAWTAGGRRTGDLKHRALITWASGDLRGRV